MGYDHGQAIWAGSQAPAHNNGTARACLESPAWSIKAADPGETYVGQLDIGLLHTYLADSWLFCYCYCYKNTPDRAHKAKPCQPGSYRTQRALS
jgi:hypothetical protein